MSIKALVILNPVTSHSGQPLGQAIVARRFTPTWVSLRDHFTRLKYKSRTVPA
jgi:hypothetical protein